MNRPKWLPYDCSHMPPTGKCRYCRERAEHRAAVPIVDGMERIIEWCDEPYCVQHAKVDVDLPGMGPSTPDVRAIEAYLLRSSPLAEGYESVFVSHEPIPSITHRSVHIVPRRAT